MWYVTLFSLPTQLCTREKERDGEKNGIPELNIYFERVPRERKKEKNRDPFGSGFRTDGGEDDNDDLLIAP